MLTCSAARKRPTAKGRGRPGELARAWRERDAWKARAIKAERQVEELKAQLEAAQREAKRQAAPFRRRKRVVTRRPPGQKPGHAPANRPPVAPDEEVDVPLDRCPCCGGPVEDLVDLPAQDVTDIPPDIKPKTTRYHGQSGYCPRCKKRVRSRHANQTSTAVGAAGVQVGPNALALAVDLKQRLGVTYRKVVDLLSMVFALRMCAGAVVRAEQRITARCEPTFHVLLHIIRRVEVVHADETGWFVVEWSRAWMWVFTSRQPALTLYFIRQSRGGDVALEVLGADFGGILGVDGWAGYLVLRCVKSQCAAHILRRCVELLEVQQRGAVLFPLAVKALMQAAIKLHHRHAELSPHGYSVLVGRLKAAMARLLARNVLDPANLRLAKHMRRHQDELLTFLDHPQVPPTNSRAEQEIRPAVVTRKISAGNRTTTGAHDREVLASLSRTAQRNGSSLFELLPPLLRSTDPAATMAVMPGLPASWPCGPPNAPSP